MIDIILAGLVSSVGTTLYFKLRSVDYKAQAKAELKKEIRDSIEIFRKERSIYKTDIGEYQKLLYHRRLHLERAYTRLGQEQSNLAQATAEARKAVEAFQDMQELVRNLFPEEYSRFYHIQERFKEHEQRIKTSNCS